MIGNMISKIREEKGMTKTELANITDINIGHITHIEKGERNPSHKTLMKICKALDVPYRQLMYTYDKSVSEEQVKYGYLDHISYDKVLAVDSVVGLINCPPEAFGASIAIKIKDNSMTPTLKLNKFAYVEFNAPLNNNDIGIFSINEDILIRRFFLRKRKNSFKSR